MSASPNPIHLETFNGKPVKVVDLRKIPEERKTAIIQAAIQVAAMFDSGMLDIFKQGSDQDASLDRLASEVGSLYRHMHDVVPMASKLGLEGGI